MAAEAPRGGPADEMPLAVKGVVDRRMAGEETLGRALAFEELLLPLPASDRKMGVLRPIVLPEPAWAMEMPQGSVSPD